MKKLLFSLASCIAISFATFANSCTTQSKETPALTQEEDVEPLRLEGVWFADGGYVLAIFDNGCFEWGYDYPMTYGTYTINGKNLVFKDLKGSDDCQPFNNTLVVDLEENTLENTESGEKYHKQEFMTEQEAKEAAEEGISAGYGYYTAKGFEEYKANVTKDIKEKL